MNLTNKITSAERNLKDQLEAFFTSKFPVEKMVSHGLFHHQRVWNYAKELLHYKKEEVNDPLFVNKLLIACYLHDIGMVIDPGTRHGSFSRELCLQFMKENKLSESDFPDLLEAIEDHDNKEYNDTTGNNILLSILSVADDLDAFGYTGVYRYLEIYLLRGIEPNRIGTLIIENAGRRFENFLKAFGDNQELVNKHRARYTILIDFFLNYNREVSTYPAG